MRLARVTKHTPVQVVNFMAERAGQQLCAADFKRFTVSVLWRGR